MMQYSNLITPHATAEVYVAEWGNDALRGWASVQPKKTLGSAMTTASALIAAGAPSCVVNVLDGAKYESASLLTVPANVTVEASAATYVGPISLGSSCGFHIGTHYAVADVATMVTRSADAAGPAFYSAKESIGIGLDGTLTGRWNIRNTGGAGNILLVDVGVMRVSASGIGISDVAEGPGAHVHADLRDLYLQGNSAIGILCGQAASDIYVVVHHILKFSSPTGTVGIQVTAAGAQAHVLAGQVVADTAYLINNGTLWLNCFDVQGTITKTGGTVIRPTLTTT